MGGLRNGLQRGTTTFSSFTAGQKAVTVLGLIALVIGGVFFFRWASTPAYAPLYTNLAPSDGSAIVEKLAAAGTPYKLANGGGTILVPRDSVYDLRLQMSGEGLPAGDDSGYSLLDKQGLSTSEFRQRVDYQRALEGELNNTLKAIDGVENAIVRLAMPEKDVFADDDGKPTASVLIKTQLGRELTSQQVRGVVHLVASSVEDLDPGSVTVTDATGKVLSNGSEGGIVGAGDERAEQTQAYEQRVGRSLESMLERVVGAGNAVVRVTADLDYDARESKSEQYTRADTPPLASQTETERFEGAGGNPVGGVIGGSGVLGPDGRPLQGGAAGAGQAGNYVNEKETVDNAVNKTTEIRKAAPGAVRRMTVAVLLNTQAAGNVDPAAVTRTVSSAVGIDRRRGDQVVVDRMAFDTTAAEQAKKDLADAQEAEKKRGLMSQIKTGALALLVLLVVLFAWLSGRKKKSGQARRVEIELLQEERRELEAARERLALEHAQNLRAIESAVAPAPVDDASVAARDEIGQLVESQPDEVAQLLRGWLADRRS
ncbi:MAG: flagellar M-ring protein FliF [Actinomycetota bacterium]|nr:flagellar M-ring protein FliF [Actinomycetota bacterium]